MRLLSELQRVQLLCVKAHKKTVSMFIHHLNILSFFVWLHTLKPISAVERYNGDTCVHKCVLSMRNKTDCSLILPPSYCQLPRCGHTHAELKKKPSYLSCRSCVSPRVFQRTREWCPLDIHWIPIEYRCPRRGIAFCVRAAIFNHLKFVI